MPAEIKGLGTDKVGQINFFENKSGDRSQSAAAREGKSFMDHLKSSIEDVNHLQNNADAMAKDVATGKSENLHETMLAISQAELAFNFMVQVRNKALEAYQDIMRMPV